jgi:tyrosyl-tRNA synthetase
MQDPAVNPSHLKRELARDLVTQYHDAEAAQAAEAHFNRLFVQHQRPQETARVEMDADEGGVWIAKVLTQAGLCDSTSAARRMIEQGAVKVDGAKVADVDLRLRARKEPYAVQVGKRGFADVVVG